MEARELPHSRAIRPALLRRTHIRLSRPLEGSHRTAVAHQRIQEIPRLCHQRLRRRDERQTMVQRLHPTLVTRS